MKTIGIWRGRDKDEALSVSAMIVENARRYGLEVVQQAQDAQRLSRGEWGCRMADIMPKLDLLIVLGGDGTILRASRAAMRYDVPVAGINMGRLGFLSEAEIGDIPELMRQIHEGAFTIENRIAIEAHVETGGQKHCFVALNDAVIARAGYARVVALRVEVNGQEVLRTICDGMIVATPAGSTAYSFSAGGPIVSPLLPCMLITPICAHAMLQRSIVVCPDDTVRIQVLEAHSEAMLTIDGADGVALSKGTEVVLQKSVRTARFLRCRQTNFYQMLQQKLGRQRSGL